MTALPAPTGLILAAPASGSGKTTVTLGLLRAFRDRGRPVAAAKCGPDYIDPRFHSAACGAACGNLDPFAMTPDRLRDLLPRPGLTLIEGVMGLFDGAAGGRGSTAELARALDLPVVLVIDAARMAQSVAAVVEGFVGHDRNIRIAGVIFNNVGSDRHEAILRSALDLTVFGAIRRAPALAHPSRHLGLVQAVERPDLDAFLTRVAAAVASNVDLDALAKAAAPLPAPGGASRLAAPAQRIAVANDAAFAFAYPHILDDWRAAGATISHFSPLADEAPDQNAELVFLPGGYPELHGPRLAAADNFRDGMVAARDRGATIYGECGGYMVLGRALTDAQGRAHRMLGLLRLETSFSDCRLHLGYRLLTATAGPFAGHWAGHEFHYATTLRAEGTPLFAATDGWGTTLDPMGLAEARVSGSFAHLIDKVP